MTDWKDYEDEYPRHKGPFLVYRPGGDGYSDHLGVSYYYEDTGFSDCEYLGPFAVTHWMEIDKPKTFRGGSTDE